MNKKQLQTFKLWVPVFLIIIIGTLGYNLVYVNNPYMEIAGVFKSFMNGSIKNNPAPEFVGIQQWFNTPNNQPVSIEDLKGKVVLVDFWTYSCINCQRDTPYIVQWYEKYKDQGLVVIGIHTPEFQFEKKYDNVMTEVTKLGITYPVALDNDYKTWRAYRNHYWPAKYLVDKDGKIVYFRFGEGAYEQTEAIIVELLQRLPSN